MIAVIEYNAGNVTSMLNALQRIGAEATLTRDPAVIRQADRVIFPGVGEAGSTMAFLARYDLVPVLAGLTQPFLGVCLGLQLMCSYSEEGNTGCIGIFSGTVRKFPPGDKVPHMGWNSIEFGAHPLFDGIPQGCDMYFVHSYYAEIQRDTVATTAYITDFSSALSRDNFHAVQFHPEKSAVNGERILKNFLLL